MAKTTLRDLGDLKKDMVQLRKKIEDPHPASSLVFQCEHCGTFWWKDELWDESDFDGLFCECFQDPAGLRDLHMTCNECDELFLIEPLDADNHLDWLQSQLRARSM